jgi:hypothetical protein
VTLITSIKGFIISAQEDRRVSDFKSVEVLQAIKSFIILAHKYRGE